ncbi:hypothetical protein [Mesobacillus zeae]|uniref:Uncharacterized protein n=1 Tax=Mesobacillus zeae TaxID=1917180 RepID=A0A398BFH2_9BACI|nr:hypothetical protein [Mesobacillus zeae]RID89005.1 hypothetical protein D1970_00445 [Mesobacillus zeae]
MKIRIIKAGVSTYWYADKIGEVFDVTGTDHPTRSGYSVRYDGECSKYYVTSDDCEIVNEEADEMDVIEKMQAEITELKSRVAALEGTKVSIREAGGKSLLPKTPQQIRDEIVAKAKADVASIVGEYEGFRTTIGRFNNQYVIPKFFVNKEKRAVTALIYGGFSHDLLLKGIAKADPSDCFNAHLGKAIALRRALGLEVPAEYYNAPQPTEVRVGDIISPIDLDKRDKVVGQSVTGRNEITVENASYYFGIGKAKFIDDSREVAE